MWRYKIKLISTRAACCLPTAWNFTDPGTTMSRTLSFKVRTNLLLVEEELLIKANLAQVYQAHCVGARRHYDPRGRCTSLYPYLSFTALSPDLSWHHRLQLYLPNVNDRCQMSDLSTFIVPLGRGYQGRIVRQQKIVGNVYRSLELAAGRGCCIPSYAGALGSAIGSSQEIWRDFDVWS